MAATSVHAMQRPGTERTADAPQDASPRDAPQGRSLTAERGRPTGPTDLHDPHDPHDPHVIAGRRSDERSSDPKSDPYQEFEEAIEQRRPPTQLPLATYLEFACRYQRDRTADDEPEYGVDWRQPLFHFVRVAKAHPELAHLSDYRAFHTIERTLRTFSLRGWDVWEKYLGIEGETARDEFALAWGTVKAPVGCDPASLAARRAGQTPLFTKADVPALRSPRYVKLISVCAWLSSEPDGRFFLSRRKAAALISCDERHAGRLLSLAVRDGFLHRVRRHHPSDRKADEYMFALDPLPPGRRKAIKRALGRRVIEGRSGTR